MAAIGKIRSWGPLLVGVIGLALFAFIAEEFVRSTESMRNDSRQQVGEVLGEKVSVQDFQALMDEYQEVMKITQGRENLTEDELNQIKDQVWSTYLQTKIIENEAKKLGLTVTDQELQNVLKEGTNPMLMQTPFVNQTTGRFDATQLKKFLADYKSAQNTNPEMMQQYQTIYKYWLFTEKTLRQQILTQKYQTLFAGCFLSNPIEQKMSYAETNEEASIQLAAIPYTTVKDADIKIEESDYKAKYNEMKEMFRLATECRDIKYVTYTVTASPADRQATMKQVTDFAKDLAAAEDPTEVVRKSTSQVSYNGLALSSRAYPIDIAQRLDSIAVGTTTAVTENKEDNTLNVIRLISKQQVPDSIQFRAIQVGAADVATARTKADSIYNAIKGGADFEALAKKYNQTGTKTWLTGVQYESTAAIDNDTKTYLQAVTTMGAGETANVQMANGNVIIQVLDRKAMKTKYVAAVIKRSLDFTKDTYSQAYNKFSAFVSETQNAEQLEANAKKNGYDVRTINDVTTGQHNVAGIRSTREALKWIFDAKAGEVSPLYECGNNDQLLVICLTSVNKEGYRSMNDERVKEYLKSEIMRDKKAEKIMANLKDVKSVDAAKAKGGQISTVDQVTFASPVFVQTTGAAEPALAGAVAGTKAGAFCKAPVKGNAGVYMFKVINKKNRPVKYDAKLAASSLRQRSLQFAGSFMNDLYLNAKVKDNRYLFF